MSGTAQHRVILLFEDELRQMAKLLVPLVTKGHEHTGAEAADFLKAAWACLYHLTQPDADQACIVLSAKPLPHKVARAKEAKAT